MAQRKRSRQVAKAATKWAVETKKRGEKYIVEFRVDSQHFTVYECDPKDDDGVGSARQRAQFFRRMFLIALAKLVRAEAV